ncbi:hypothetical protein BGZ70_008856 [Mortierella alpina]|uniref:PAS domain-containing protein n=1 Tax=Mortierella alpina TaxID=64518 RepID=A0A9P6J2G4_MORAP|nr:hypothetical protein BGZ70_008856 [Mortierella alpina]
MVEANSFIAFNDLTPAARYLWLSPSVEDCIGFTPEELLGVSSYDMLIKDDVALTKVTHQEHMLNDMVATQIVVRFKHKYGGSVVLNAVFNRQIRSHSAAMARIVESKQKVFERLRRHHKAFKANTWDPSGLEPEPRVCMILNRFSRALGVLYASPSCEFILHVNAEEVVGNPFLFYIRADDLATFVEQVQVAKASNVITHMRFWFQSPNCAQEIPCEAILFGTPDGMVVVMRRCRPFVRRRLIGGVNSHQKWYPNPTALKESSESSYPTPSSSTSTSPSSSLLSDSSLLNDSSLSRLESMSISENIDEARGTATATISMGSIKRIIELDGHDDLKPLMSLQPEDPDLVEGTTVLPPGMSIMRHHVRTDSQEGHVLDDGQETTG